MALLAAAPQAAPAPDHAKGIPSTNPRADAKATIAVESARAAERQADAAKAAKAAGIEVRDGDILVLARDKKGDPLQGANVKAFGATQAVDSAVVGPVARVYKRKVPSPIRSGIHNFLYNLKEPVVFLNFLLQFKPGKAAETAGRFVINSTVGVAGVFDFAKRKPFRLPRRANGFADTLGYHGVKNGPFLFLPIVGPTTARDLFGGFVDRLILPVTVGHPFTSATYTAPLGVLGALDHRADFDETLEVLHDGSVDPYTASREFYLRRRQAEIDHLHGRDPVTPPPVVRTLPVVEADVAEPGAVPGPVEPVVTAPVAVPETVTP
jgi:phospholipid-binding lipoprotein MlaA